MRRPGQTEAQWRAELGAACRSRPSTFRFTSSPSSRTRSSNAFGRRASWRCPTRTSAAPCSTRRRRSPRSTACRPTSRPTTRAPARKPAQSRLLALWRICRRRPRRAWPHRRAGERRRAQANEKHPEMWLAQVEIEGHGLVEDDPLSLEEQSDEFLLMGLRLREGVDPPLRGDQRAPAQPRPDRPARRRRLREEEGVCGLRRWGAAAGHDRRRSRGLSGAGEAASGARRRGGSDSRSRRLAEEAARLFRCSGRGGNSASASLPNERDVILRLRDLGFQPPEPAATDGIASDVIPAQSGPDWRPMRLCVEFPLSRDEQVSIIDFVLKPRPLAISRRETPRPGRPASP